MEKIKLEILGLSPSTSHSNSFVLVLGEEFGTRRLPIIIGLFEAQSISVAMEHIVPNRPMTHDLFTSFSEALEFRMDEILISAFRDGVFFAQILCHNQFSKHQIDARPSDAISIAVRVNAPIFATEQVLQAAGITLDEVNKEEEAEDYKEVKRSRPQKTFSESLKDFSIDQLTQMLNEALQKEEYEKAAKLRDELSKRN